MKLDRLLGILTVLLKNDRVSAPQLAEKFEVTRRTIGRDIDTLCQAGIPIVTYQGGGGGISIADGYKLDKSILTTLKILFKTTNEQDKLLSCSRRYDGIENDLNREWTYDSKL